VPGTLVRNDRRAFLKRPATLYLSKVPMTAVDLLHNRVLPFYEEQGVAVVHLLTDNGREYCGRPLRHPFELYLAINQITPRRTEIGSPEANGFCERFHRTVKEEVFAVAFRKTFYERVAQLQGDLDTYSVLQSRARAPGLPHAGAARRTRPSSMARRGQYRARRKTELLPEINNCPEIFR
jgi:transposase InsO family protein